MFHTSENISLVDTSVWYTLSIEKINFKDLCYLFYQLRIVFAGT